MNADIYYLWPTKIDSMSSVSFPQMQREPDF